jgi:hypothetical protein
MTCIEFLLSLGANAHARNESGGSPLYRPVVYRNKSACGALLRAGADPKTIFENMSSHSERISPRFTIFL